MVTSASTPLRMRGLSLIEMMVVLAMMLLLAAAAAPFSSRWADQAAVNQGHAQLRLGMAQLRALALRNTAAAPHSTAAAVLVSVPGSLCVQVAAPTTLSCTGAAWRAIPTASISLSGAMSQCLAMNSGGNLLPSSLGCSVSLSYRIVRGSESFDGSL